MLSQTYNSNMNKIQMENSSECCIDIENEDEVTITIKKR